MDLSGTFYYTSFATQIINNASDTILANARMVVLGQDANYTLTFVLTIANGDGIGQLIYITCVDG